MSGLLALWGWLRGPPLLGLLSLLAVAEASGRAFGPRMHYDEWTPLGRGDPLKNDPTYDYVPPVLDRVHYWMEDGGARRGDGSADNQFNLVPVPPTMLVPPPPPPPPPQPPPTTTAAPPTPVPPTPASPSTASSYSSLNPFHHFEDLPVVPNVHFQEEPLLSFDLPPPQGNVVVFDAEKLSAPTKAPAKAPTKAPIKTPTKAHSDDKVAAANKHAVRFDQETPALVSKPRFPLVTMSPPPPPPPPPPSTDGEAQSAISNVIGGAGAPDTPESLPRPPPPRKQHPAMVSMTPPPPPSTSSSLPPPPTPTRAAVTEGSIESLIRGLLHQDAATTMTTLTTDPLFAHYKQPATPVNGPAYLIIQGHSKVKTYGPSRGFPVNNHLERPSRGPARGPPRHRARRRAAA